ncbi:MAG: hypothetical protein ACRC1K_14380 [Planctomycetia bacterium]
MAMDSDGDFVVTWSSNDQDGGGYGVYSRLYNAAGEPRGDEFQVNSYTTDGQSFSNIAMNADGDFVVVWQSFGQDGSGSGVYAKRYNSAGSPQGGEFRVNTFTTNTQSFPSVAMDADGDFVVAWHSAGQDGSDYGVYAKRYDGAGTPQGTEFRVNSHIPNSQFYPTLGMDAEGDFVVVWQSRAQDGDDWGVYGQLYNAAGAAEGSEFRVNTSTTGPQDRFSVEMDADGDFIVAWISNDLINGYGVYAQLFDDAGSPDGGEFRVNTNVDGNKGGANVEMDADGDFVVAWQSNGQDGSGYGVYARRYTTDDQASTPTLSTGPSVPRNQGSPIPLDITVTSNDIKEPTETISVRIEGAGTGAVFSAGTADSQGNVTLTAAQLAGLTVTFPADFFGQVTLSVFARSRESVNNELSEAAMRTLSVNVLQVTAAAPMISATPAVGDQDTVIPLSFTASKRDPNSPETLTVRVTGVPDGAQLFLDGQPVANGVTLSAPFGALSIRPKPGSVDPIALTLEAITAIAASNTTANATASLSITVRDTVATRPDLPVTPTGFFRVTASDDILLGISVINKDTDSEDVVVFVENVPAGGTLSQGTRLPDGRWRLTEAEVAAGQREGLKLRLLPDFAVGFIQLRVTAVSTERNGGATSAPPTEASIFIANMAPMLAAGNPNTRGASTTRGATTGQLLTRGSGARAGALVSDSAGAQRGIAMTQVRVSGGGAMEYRLGNGRWKKMPRLSANRALLLKAGDRIRYTGAGRVQMQYAAWDQTSGLAGQQISAAARGGNTAFSARQARATVGGAKRSVETAGLGLSAALAATSMPKTTAAAEVLSASAVDAAFIDFTALLDAD